MEDKKSYIKAGIEKSWTDHTDPFADAFAKFE